MRNLEIGRRCSAGWTLICADDQLHTGHPRYFGLFNPAPLPLGVAAEALVAAYNPQLAAWSHSPFGVEAEQHLIRSFARKFGYCGDTADGTFCTGGAEANHTALVCALNRRFPEFDRLGVRGLASKPVIFISKGAHHSWEKAARASGLDTDSVRMVAVGREHSMDIADLRRQIVLARQQGEEPTLVCGTAGTTAAGIIDPLKAIADTCKQESIWFHVDAAWGGAAALVPSCLHHFQGMQESDSITFDVHKSLSIPMGASLFLTQDVSILSNCFKVQTDYMPGEASMPDVAEPYVHSMQWSRRFIGLKLLFPLAVAGWGAFEKMISRQIELGGLLREMLVKDGWNVVNRTPLPVVCFRDADDPEGVRAKEVANAVVSSGQAWISLVRLGVPVLRACITNFRTQESDLSALIHNLQAAR